MRELVDGLLAVLLAPLCGACRRPLPRPTRGCICEDCWNSIVMTIRPTCQRCGGHLEGRAGSGTTCATCAQTDSAISQARAIGPHVGSLRAIVHTLKYDGRRSIARPLAVLMCAAADDIVRDIDAVVPVPLHPARRRERGFNQATDLARCIGPPVVSALRRVRRTDTQTALPGPARRANVDGAFRATRRAISLRGLRVLLVDDVRTTGATLEACARVLREEGVGEVFALTAARVEAQGD